MKVTLGDPGSVTALASRGDGAARKAATASAASAQTSARRWANPCRPTRKVWATSASGTSGWAARNSARFRVAASSAAADRADQTSKLLEGCGRARSGNAGASSSTTCALVPPMPNELTPARRGPRPAGQGRATPLTTNGLVAKWHLGLGVWKCPVGGRTAWRTACAAVIRPAMPAAESRCPTWLFTEPSAQ